MTAFIPSRAPELKRKASGENPWLILQGHDPTLQDDTLTLFGQLTGRLGYAGFGRLILMEYPWLLKPETPLLRVWWVLSNIAAALPTGGAEGESGR